MAPVETLQFYVYRLKIELRFRQAVYALGAYAHNFWMMDIKPVRRGSGDQYLHKQSDAYRNSIRPHKIRAKYWKHDPPSVKQWMVP
jgi:hypothetical protein